MAITGDTDDDDMRGSKMSIKTFETADSVQSLQDSIISLYDDTPYGKHRWSISQASFLTAHESQDTQNAVTEFVEDYLKRAPIHPNKMKDVQEESSDGLTEISKASEFPFSRYRSRYYHSLDLSLFFFFLGTLHLLKPCVVSQGRIQSVLSLGTHEMHDLKRSWEC